jgi:hypothetical protein
MIDKIKYYAKLSSIGFFSFLKYFAVGNISAVSAFVIGLFILLYQTQVNAPHAGGSASALVIFAMAPVQSVLLVLVLASSYLVFSLASGYAMKKVIRKLLDDQSESTLYPLIDKVLDKAKKNKNTSLLKKGADISVVQIQLIDTIRQESENKWIKKALAYGFKKIKLDDIDFHDEQLDAYEVIRKKTVQALQHAAQPDKQKLWLIIGFHWVVVVVVVFLARR